ncbi:MAG: glycine cleavage T C-terminal barrel domain-containing protein [Abditibacteriaceae bacterium]
MFIIMTLAKSTFTRSLSHFGHFRVSGKDAAALLHHLTTNDINALKPGQSCEAVLVTGKARCLDVLTIVRLEKDFLVITSPNRRDMFAPHANGFIVFRQDVKIEDITGQISTIGVFGTDAHDVMSVYLSPEALPKENDIRRIKMNNAPVDVLRTGRLPGDGFLLMTASAETAQQIQNDLKLPECDNETYNILRVEAGVPVAGLEITEAHNPWEANLDQMISLHKGCYNGQEIISRLNTYEKVKQHLKVLRLSGCIPPNVETTLQSDGKNAGELTSIVNSPRHGNIALAYIKKNYEPIGTALKVLFDGVEVDAEVVDLPF